MDVGLTKLTFECFKILKRLFDVKGNKVNKEYKIAGSRASSGGLGPHLSIKGVSKGWVVLTGFYWA